MYDVKDLFQGGQGDALPHPYPSNASAPYPPTSYFPVECEMELSGETANKS